MVRSHDGSAIASFPPNSIDVQWCTQSRGWRVTKPHIEYLSEQNGAILRFPMVRKGITYAILCLEVHLDARQIQTLEPLILWSISWLELVGEHNAQSDKGLERVLNILETVSQYGDVKDSSEVLASTLASTYGLAGVYLAVRINGQYQVLACSHQRKLDPESSSVQKIQRALNTKDFEEQKAAVELLQAHYESQVPAMYMVRLPITGAQGDIGQVILFYANTQKHRISTVNAQVRMVNKHLAPLFEQLIHQSEHWLWRFHRRVLAILKHKTWWPWPVLLATGVILSLVQIPKTVSADANLEGAVQMAIVAPEDGYLESVSVKAGQIIEKGQVLAHLDDQAIRAEIRRWQSEYKEFERQYSKELNALNPVQMRIAKAKMEQAKAQLNLQTQKLERVHIKAPMSGVVVSGDLSRAIGSPVKKGQPLYEMAPLNAFKLVIWASEKDIQSIKKGQTGELLLNAFPQHAVTFRTVSVSSLYQEGQADVTYRIEAHLEPTGLSLRPGMSGIAKIKTSKVSLLSLLFRDPYEWLRMRIWSL